MTEDLLRLLDWLKTEQRRDWGQVYTIYYAKRADAHPQADLFGGRGEGLGRLSGGVESSPTSGAREEPLF
jgi:hypothetical protein